MEAMIILDSVLSDLQINIVLVLKVDILAFEVGKITMIILDSVLSDLQINIVQVLLYLIGDILAF